MTPPKGMEDLEAVVANASANATVTLPAAWLGALLAYVRWLQAGCPPA